MPRNARGPKFVQFFDPVIQSLKQLGGSARPAEVVEAVARLKKISESQRQEMLQSGGLRFDNQIHFARQYLVWAGYLESSKRGIWSLTQKGFACPGLSVADALELFREQHGLHSSASDANEADADKVDLSSTEPPLTCKEQVLPERNHMSDLPSFDDFKRSWLEDILQDKPSSLEKGRRFARKLLTQWKDIDPEEDADDVIFCDGSCDGGIDIAYLDQGSLSSDTASDETSGQREDGDTWYLVQSKYGSAFRGASTIFDEGRKVIETLAGRTPRLSSLAENLLTRLRTFLARADRARDRLVLVLATDNELSKEQRRALQQLRTLGVNEFGPLFDIDDVSLQKIYQRVQATPPAVPHPTLKAKLIEAGPSLWVGAVTLPDMFAFLGSFRNETGDLDQIYEKNVRRFLSPRGKVNSGIRKTLEEHPEFFGLYNNGITVVVNEVKRKGKEEEYVLTNPFVVNGCQTTRTIWNVFHPRLNSGGTGNDPSLLDWLARAQRGHVVLKLVSGVDEEQLKKITKFTNTQNKTLDKDFVGLNESFQTWAKTMKSAHGIFLEIQRGEWDSWRARKSQDDSLPTYADHTHAFDLLKVYGAGWLAEVGAANGKNPAFAPDGHIFEDIIRAPNDPDAAFDADDLLAAYNLQAAAVENGFGRSPKKDKKPTRRLTRYLFFMVTIELLKSVLQDLGTPTSRKQITAALLRLWQPPSEAKDRFIEHVCLLIDEYMRRSDDGDTFNREPDFPEDLNKFMKSERFGRDKAFCPRLYALLKTYERLLKLQGDQSVIAKMKAQLAPRPLPAEATNQTPPKQPRARKKVQPENR